MTRLAVILLSLLPLAALADRRELYTFLEAAPGQAHAVSDVGGQARPLTLGAQVLAYYGLTHELHVGASLGGSRASNLRFERVAVQLPDGSTPLGDVYEDRLALTAAAVLAYRYDTGRDYAPVARLELGGTFLHASNAAFFPSGTQLVIGRPTRSALVPTTRLVVSAEYRLANWWVASLGLSVRHNFGALTPWQFELPLTIGRIW